MNSRLHKQQCQTAHKKSGDVTYCQVPCFMGPKISSWSNTGLDLIDNHEDAMLLSQIPKSLEELWRRVVITTLTLDRFDDHSNNRGSGGLRLHLFLGDGKAAGLFLIVLGLMFVQWVLEVRERACHPVLEGWDIHLVESLGMGGGERTKETSMEAAFKAHNRQV